MQGFKEEPFQQIPWVPTPPHPEPCKGAHSPGCSGPGWDPSEGSSSPSPTATQEETMPH